MEALPDHSLVSIFGCLALQKRHRALPLVCRRFWELVNSPERLVDVYVQFRGQQWVPRLRALCHWLLLHAASPVRRLCLSGAFNAEAGQDAFEVEGLLAAIVVGCAAAGGLEELHLLDWVVPLVCSSWLVALRGSLRRLTLFSQQEMAFTVPLAVLTGLEELEVCAHNADAWPALPVSLTKLVVGHGMFGDAMPDQVAALTRLRHVELSGFELESEGFSPLLALRSMRLLQLTACAAVPAKLSQLTWLEALTINDDNDALADSPVHGKLLVAALPQLTRLRHLALTPVAGVDIPPAAMAGLSCLHTFIWGSWRAPPAGAVLPPGSWLGSLRLLVAPAHLLANSLPLLAVAPMLAHLVVTSDSEHGEATRGILRSAAGWPSLQRLSLITAAAADWRTNARVPASLLPDALQAQRQRPSLTIDAYRNMWRLPGMPSDASLLWGDASQPWWLRAPLLDD